MANEEQLSILKQGVEVWNKWREENPKTEIDLAGTDLTHAWLWKANLTGADLRAAHLLGADLLETNLEGANLEGATLFSANLWAVTLLGSKWSRAKIDATVFADSDLSQAIGLERVIYFGPSSISTDTFARSKGKIHEVFLRGCGLRDWEVESVKLYNPDLTNEERNRILYRIFDLQASQAIQVSPLFISYSRADSQFVEKLEKQLTQRGIRYWRDVEHAVAGRLEKQIDRAIRQDPTVLLVLSQQSLSSDWVEHEVRTARGLEKEMGRDVLCPVALDDSWKDSRWPKRIMEQITEYNILDFSQWDDDSKFDSMFRKLIDGLELFYKG